MKLFIKHYRRKRKMTAEQLSNLTGISKSYLSEIENNKSNPTLDKLDLIAAALEVCPRVLIQCEKDIDCTNCLYNMCFMGV